MELFPEHRPEERGNVQPDMRRIAAMVAYMSDLSKGPLFRHKLHKLLFFADLLHYEETGKSISGLHYLNGPWGPIPERADLLYEWLVLKGLLIKQEMRFPASDYFGMAFLGGNDVDLDLLKDEERGILERIIEAYKQATPTMLIEESKSCLKEKHPPFLEEFSES